MSVCLCTVVGALAVFLLTTDQGTVCVGDFLPLCRAAVDAGKTGSNVLLITQEMAHFDSPWNKSSDSPYEESSC